MNPSDFGRLIEGLMAPGAYPHPADQVVHIETHISHVLLAGDFAYKLKKPLNLGFLDFSTLERRRDCCLEELRLNRRLAPGLYLGVVPVTGTPEHPSVGGTQAANEPVLEWAVRMKRFPQEDLLDRCALTPDLVDRLADRVAAFHGQVPSAPPGSAFGTPEAVLEPMLENLRHVRARVQEPGNARRLDRLEAWTRTRWNELMPVIRSRRIEGRVRECHGDMHRGNIVLMDGEPLIFDALEFNPNLRWIDTASELAFLIMDIEETGEQALARRLLNRYLELGGDYGALQMLDFYKVYRAMVRAKVLAIRLGQPGLSPDEALSERRDCARYLALAETYTRRRRPRLLIACGLSGSGKSRLGRRLREALPVVQLRSDVERKRLFGLDPGARTAASPNSGIYFPQATEWTYQRLRRFASMVLGCGYDVLVDATFLTRERRRVFRELANSRDAGFVVLGLSAPVEVLRQRVTRRLAEGCDASEASLAVLERQLAACEHLDALEQAEAIRIDSTSPPDFQEVLARIADISGIAIGD